MKTRTRPIAAALIGVVLATSCVQQDPPGLSLSELEAKLVFGIDEAPEPGLTPTEASQRLPMPDSDLFVRDGGKTLRPFYSGPGPEVDPCPPAKNASAVKFGATDNVNTDGQGNRPVEGVYPWRIMTSTGERDLPYDRLTPAGFELRAIRNVTEVPPEQWSASTEASSNREVFTYEEVRNLSFVEIEATSTGTTETLVERFLISTYQVDTAAARVRANQTDAVVQLPSAGHPERGISLLATVLVDGAGEPVPGIDPFEPTTGLTLMGLPFVSNESFTASATDASHGTTITTQTLVGPRKKQNMCGELMQGFPASGTQTISTSDPSAPSQAFEFETWYAPQHGGVSIYEDTYGVTTGQRVLLHRASLEPTGPVPADGLPR